jgi:hypothetical protein
MLQNIKLKITGQLKAAISYGSFIQTSDSQNPFTLSGYVLKLARSLNCDLQRMSKQAVLDLHTSFSLHALKTI